MKKVLSVLAIMFVVLMVCFAAEGDPKYGAEANGTAQLKVETMISAILPDFQLQAKSVATATAVGDVEDAKSNVTTPEGGTAPTVDTVTVTTDDMLEKNAVVTFAINQISNSRCNAVYKFSVVATDMVLIAKANGVAPTSADLTELGDTAKFKLTTDAAKAANPTITGNSVANITFSDAAAEITATYNGNNIAADTELARFSCEWVKNAQAVAGKYQAKVTLTVAAQ